VRAYKVVSTDFGLPTRRQRLYFIGVSKAHYPLFDMNKVTEILSLLKLETQQPVTGRNSIYNKYSIMYSNIILLIYSYSYT
jgi:site-specific DNA-cytosine methylase